MSSDFTKFRNGLTVGKRTSDPVDGVNGDIYYNTTTNKFRKYQNGGWEDLDVTGGSSSLTKIEFSSSTTWPVPVGVTEIFVIGVGGGGGGGGGGSGSSAAGGGGGSGGCGATPYFYHKPVVPGDVLNIQIGVGGTGGNGGASAASGVDGTDGTDTTVVGLVDNNVDGSYVDLNTNAPHRNGINLIFPGAAAGDRGTYVAAGTGVGGVVTGPDLNTSYAPIYVIGSSGGAGGSGLANDGNSGSSNIYARGGNSGQGGLISGLLEGGGGGGGGGAGLALGGHGGHGGSGGLSSYAIASAVRTSNTVVLTLVNADNYSVNNFNVGEQVKVTGVTTASFNGDFVITAVPTNLTIEYTQVGIDETATVGPGIIYPVKDLIGTIGGGRGVDGTKGSGGGGGAGGGGRSGAPFHPGGNGGDGGDGYVIILY